MAATKQDTEIPSNSFTPFEYDSALEEYKISEEEYLKQNPQYDALCTGICVFNTEGKLLLVQRAKTEKAYPNIWEIPGGKVDGPDESILHAAVRELREEAGLEATKITRKVGEFTFGIPRAHGRVEQWKKHIFEMEVKDISSVALDPVEHQDYLFASEQEVIDEKAGGIVLKYITSDNKVIKLDAFRHGKGAASL